MNFEAVNMAYEVLSDPGLRAEFDKVKGVDRDGEPTFTGADFFEALKQGALLRSTVLCILCDRRRMRPYRPTLTMRNIENMLQTTAEELIFAMWYLKQRGMVLSDDKSTLQITADGMDFLERNPPSPEGVLSLIKPEAMSVQNAPVQTVLGALHRVLTRDHQPQNVRSVAPRPK
jgi:hypothetical protein